VRDAHDRLRDRVWSCVPVTGQAFATLLSLLEVGCSDAVPTACVTTGERSRMLLNPGFVAKHCRTDEHLAMLVLHELYHVLLGHTRLYPRVTPAQNWAFDCLINAQLCRLFPQPRYTSFFAQFVKGDGGVADLLAPPAGWHPGLESGHLARLRRRAVAANPRLGDAHWRLYGDDAITTEELYRLLERVAGEGGDAPLRGQTLLGNHADDAPAELHPEAMREVREIVARWPIVERRSGRDQGGELREERIPLGCRRRQAVAVLRRALARAAGTGEAGLAPRVGLRERVTLSPVDLGGDRRAAVQRAAGHEPLFFASTATHRAAASAERVRVYLDVSGSMEAVMPPLYAALAGCLDQVEPIVWGFSTQVAPLTHAQLRRGVRLTTGGTDIDAVTTHLLAHRARRALVVTDGWVGAIPADHLARMRRDGVRLVAAVTDGGDPGFASAAGYPVLRLPPLAE
jgi:hypothetical protein